MLDSGSNEPKCREDFYVRTHLAPATCLPVPRRIAALSSAAKRVGWQRKNHSVRDFVECIRGDGWDDGGKYQGITYKRTRWIKPDILRLDRVGVSDYVLFFNSTSGWEIL
jgi:hypothetical protein